MSSPSGEVTEHHEERQDEPRAARLDLVAGFQAAARARAEALERRVSDGVHISELLDWSFI